MTGTTSDNWFKLKLINKCSAKWVTLLAPPQLFSLLLVTYILPFPQHIASMFVFIFSEEEVEAAGAGF